MKILIVSDTHRKDTNLKQVIEAVKPIDMLIHLGDAEGSEYAIAPGSMKAASWKWCWGTMISSHVWSGSVIST